MIEVAVLVCTYGSDDWAKMAVERAVPSAYAAGFPFVAHYHLDDGELAQVRNTAASTVSAEWLVFLDADDRLMPGYREALELDASESGVLCCPKMKVRWSASPADWPNLHASMEELNHCVIGTAVPRWLFQMVGGFREDLPIYEDWELWLRCLRAGARIEYVEAVYEADLGSGRNTSLGQRERQQVLEQIRRGHHQGQNGGKQK